LSLPSLCWIGVVSKKREKAQGKELFEPHLTQSKTKNKHETPTLTNQLFVSHDKSTTHTHTNKQKIGSG